MTVASKVISAVYPVASGTVAALTTKGLLHLGKRLVVGKSKTPSGRGGGGTAVVWTALSWAVAGGIGLGVGRDVRKRLVREPVSAQPAQS